MNKRQTYEQANKVFDKAVKLEQDFGEFFTGLFSVLCFMWLVTKKKSLNPTWGERRLKWLPMSSKTELQCPFLTSELLASVAMVMQSAGACLCLQLLYRETR